MGTQLDIFTSIAAAENGMNRAINSANELHENWSEKAFIFLRNYIKTHPEFMAENVRKAAEGIVPEPPSERAWGGIIKRAASQKLIYRKGFQAVSNIKAHATPASVWGRV